MRLLSLLATMFGAGPDLAAKAAAPADPRQHLAFVLVENARFPSSQQVLAAYRAIASKGDWVMRESGSKDGILSFSVGKDGFAAIAFVPAPVPKGEAEAAHDNSYSSGLAEWGELRPHHAHLIVTLRDDAGRTRYQGLERFTYLVAAAAQASKAVAVYWGAAHATHDARYFIDRAEQRDPDLMMGLWTGIVVRPLGKDRMSVVTLGMREQLGIMELRLTAPLRDAETSVLRMFDFLALAAREGAELPDGDTIGRDEHERLKIHHEPSPIVLGQKVWRIDLP